MPPREPDTDHQGDTSHAWVVIPYFPGDEGHPGVHRPLTLPPAGFTGVTYLCPAIKVRGVNYTSIPGTYRPDEPLAITVDVDNRGMITAQVFVEVFWADPGTGFSNPAPVASDAFAVPSRPLKGPITSHSMIWTPDQTKIPPHFCLLVKATATLQEDPSTVVPANPDPVNDRHWAQYNLTTETVPASQKHVTVIWAANPMNESAAFTVAVRPVPEEGLRVLAREVRAEPLPIRARTLTLRRATADASESGSRENTVVLELGRGERQALVVSAESPELAGHQFTAFEVVQSAIGDGREAGAVTGSLGVVLFAGEERRPEPVE